MTYEWMDGSNERVHLPEYGPFDHRYGYTALPALLPRVCSR